MPQRGGGLWARLFLAALAALGAGCFVEISHVDDPRVEFAQARADATRLRGRPGPAHSLHVLAYDKDERELVKVSLPLWLVKKIAKSEVGELDLDGDVDGRLRGCLARHVRLEDLVKAGRGLLVEAEEEDGDQVLVWLR